MNTDMERRVRSDVVDAYRSVTRLRVYIRLVLLASVLFFMANLGGMIVGWLPVDIGALGLVATALTATTTVAKGHESVHRTTLYAMELERTLPGDENLDTSSVTGQSVRTLSAVAMAVTAVLGTGIVAYSLANAGSQQPVTNLSQAFVPEDERDDDDDDDDDEDREKDGNGDDADGDDADGDDADGETDSEQDEQLDEATEDQPDPGAEPNDDEPDNDEQDDD